MDIQAEINALPAIGGSVFIPPGDYELSSLYIGKPRVHLYGAGRTSTRLYFTGAGLGGVYLGLNGAWDCTIRDLHIGVDARTAIYPSNLVWLRDCMRTKFQSVVIDGNGFGINGVSFDGMSTTPNRYCILEDVWVQGCKGSAGIILGGETTVNYLNRVQCYKNTNGLVIAGARSFSHSIRDYLAESNDHCGIDITWSYYNVFNNVYLEKNGQRALNLNGQMLGNQFLGGYVTADEGANYWPNAEELETTDTRVIGTVIYQPGTC